MKNSLSIQVVPDFIKPIMLMKSREQISHMFRGTHGSTEAEYMEIILDRVTPLYDLHNSISEYAKQQPFGTKPSFPWVKISVREAEVLTKFFKFMTQKPWTKL